MSYLDSALHETFEEELVEEVDDDEDEDEADEEEEEEEQAFKLSKDEGVGVERVWPSAGDREDDDDDEAEDTWFGWVEWFVGELIRLDDLDEVELGIADASSFVLLLALSSFVNELSHDDEESMWSSLYLYFWL